MEPTPEGFTDRPQALAWLDAERDNLLAAATLADTMMHTDIARDLPMALENYLGTHGHPQEWRASAELAIRAAQTLRDQHGEARARVSLSDALRELKAHDEAIAEAHRAAEIFHALGDQPGEGGALRALASALSAAGQHEECLRMSEQAVPLLRQGSNRHIAAVGLMDYGSHLTDVERYDEAIDALMESLATLSQTSKTVKAHALLNLAFALEGAGRRAEAISSFQESIACALETGSGTWETDIAARASASLGELLSVDEQLDQASRYFRQSAALFTKTGNDSLAAEALKELGLTLIDLEQRREEVSGSGFTATTDEGHYQQAADALAEAIALTRRAADSTTEEVRQELANLLITLSGPLVRLDRRDGALNAIREALVILRHLADEDPQVHQPPLAGALDMLAWALAQDDAQLPEALEAAAEAVDIATGLAQKSPQEHAELLQDTVERKAALLGELAKISVYKISHATMSHAKEGLSPMMLERETGLMPSQIAAGTAWLDAYHRSQRSQ